MVETSKSNSLNLIYSYLEDFLTVRVLNSYIFQRFQGLKALVTLSTGSKSVKLWNRAKNSIAIIIRLRTPKLGENWISRSY